MTLEAIQDTVFHDPNHRLPQTLDPVQMKEYVSYAVPQVHENTFYSALGESILENDDSPSNKSVRHVLALYLVLLIVISLDLTFSLNY